MIKSILSAALVTASLLTFSACGSSEPRTVVITKTAQPAPQDVQMSGEEALTLLESSSPGFIAQECNLFTQAANSGINPETLRSSFIEGWNSGADIPNGPNPSDVYDALLGRCFS